MPAHMTVEEAYEILEVENQAGEGAVKKAYRKLALKWHPDKNPDDRENANKQFLRISEAYKRITEPESFKDEDDGEEPSAEEMEQMFNMMFASMMGGLGRKGGGPTGGGPFGGGGGVEMFMGPGGEMFMGVPPGGGGFFDEEEDSDDEDFAYGGAGMSMEELLMMSMMGMGPGMGPGMGGRGPHRGTRSGGPSGRGRGGRSTHSIPREKYSYSSSKREDKYQDDDWETASDSEEESEEEEDSDENDHNEFFDEDMIKFLQSGIKGKQGGGMPKASTEGPPLPPPGQGKNAKKNARRNAKKKEIERAEAAFAAEEKGKGAGGDSDDDSIEANDELLRFIADEWMMSGGSGPPPPEFVSEFVDMMGDFGGDVDSMADEMISSHLTGLGVPAQFLKKTTAKGKQEGARAPSSVSGKKKSTPEIGDVVGVNSGAVGVVAYIGPVHYANGDFAGVIMDPGEGKNDGSIKGKRYFECEAGCGLMVKLRDLAVLS